MLLVGGGRSLRNRLNKVGDRTAPCGTPLGRLRMAECCVCNVILAERLEMKEVSHRVSFGCRSRSRSLSVSWCLGTVSKVLLMSMVASTVRFGGTVLLKPSAICWVSLVKYVVVLCEDRKPCWWSAWDMKGEMRCRTRLSITLEGQHRSEIGLYEEVSSAGLLGLGIGMM